MPLNFIASSIGRHGKRVAADAEGGAAALATRYGLFFAWNAEDRSDSYGLAALGYRGWTSPPTVESGKVANCTKFVRASTQSLRSNSSIFKAGDVDFWACGWLKLSTVGIFQNVIAKYDDVASNEWAVRVHDDNKLAFTVSGNGTAVTHVYSSATLSADTWTFWMVYHDATANEIGVSLNGGAFATASHTTGIFAGTAITCFGVRSDFASGSFLDGFQDSVVIGKSPPLGIASLKTEIRDYFYDGGSGRSWTPSAATSQLTRAALINFVFGQSTIPTTLPTIFTSAADPFAFTAATCTRLEYDFSAYTAAGLNKFYLYTTTETPLNRLVVLCQGHNELYTDGGFGVLGQKLLDLGFDLLLCGMPGKPPNGGNVNHALYTSLIPFVGLIHYALNEYAEDYDDVSMLGLSGGGWTTVLCAAMDPRIKVSVSVAGSLPQEFRTDQPNSEGDWEQTRVYALAECTYIDMYFRGCDSAGRAQVQAHNRHDLGAFSRDGSIGAYGASYQADVADGVNRAAAAVGGSFSFVEDDKGYDHQIGIYHTYLSVLPALGYPAPTPALDEVLDDGDAGHSMVGTIGTPNVGGQDNCWTQWTGGNAFSNLAVGDEYYTCPGDTASTLESIWEFTGLDAGDYLVCASFITSNNRASNATYKLYDDATLRTTAQVDQSTSDNLLKWAEVGMATISSGTLRVKLVNTDADGFVAADAVRVVRVG